MKTARSAYAATLRADRTEDLRVAYAARRTQDPPVAIAWGTTPATVAECRRVAAIARDAIRASAPPRQPRGIFAVAADFLGLN